MKSGLSSTAKLDDSSAIAFRWPGLRDGFKQVRRLAFFRCFLARRAALVRLAIHGLGHGCRTADIADYEHLDVEVAAVIGDLQPIADMHLARSFCRMAVGLDPAQLAGFLRQRPRLEKARSPQPEIHPYGVH